MDASLIEDVVIHSEYVSSEAKEFSSGGAALEVSMGTGSQFTLHQYMKEVNSVPLLSHQQTMDLFRAMEEKKSQLERCLQRDADAGELERLEREITSIKERLITANLRLVVYLANRYQGRGISIQDLVQEGNIGLMRAIEKFDYRLGYRFSTYATWWIRQGMLRAIHQQGRIIRVPTHMLDKFQKYMRSLEPKPQTEPNAEEERPYEEVGKSCSEEDLDMTHLSEIMRDPLSLDAPVTDEGLHLQEVTEDEQHMGPDEYVIDRDLRIKLRSALTELPLREEIILRLRYGIDLPSTHTLEEVGRLFSLTKERIRQIEARALRRMYEQKLLS